MNLKKVLLEKEQPEQTSVGYCWKVLMSCEVAQGRHTFFLGCVVVESYSVMLKF